MRAMRCLGLASFPKSAIRLLPGSTCISSLATTQEKKSGNIAVAVPVSVPTFEGAERVSFSLARRFNGFSGVGYRCIATRRADQWAVQSCKMAWVA